MGAPSPFGPDIHPNAVGYAVIAGAFAEKIATHWRYSSSYRDTTRGYLPISKSL
jgi:hypothetical protein